MAHKIIMNNETLLQGDSETIGVIFNNLSGKNITDSQKYQEYLQYMEGVTAIEIKGEISRVRENGETIETGVIACQAKEGQHG